MSIVLYIQYIYAVLLSAWLDTAYYALSKVAPVITAV
jgi:hypothetical protein